MTAQAMQALEIGNGIRIERANILKGVRQGRRSVKNIIADPPDSMKTCELRRLLMARPHWGKKKTECLCAQLAIRSTWRLGEIPASARVRLLRAL